MTGRRLITLAILAAFVGGCNQAPRANPTVATDVRSMTDAPISGRASLAQRSPDTLDARIGVTPADLPPLAAEVRRGDCTSGIVLADLAVSPDDRFSLAANLDGTFASTLPVAIVLRDDSTGMVIACGALTIADLQP